MRVTLCSVGQHQVRPPLSQTQSPARQSQTDESFWRELRNDLRDYVLHFNHENIDQLSQAAQSMGSGLKGAWKFVKDVPAKILDLPMIAERVTQEDRNQWLEIGGQVGLIAGFVAAGAYGAAGGTKMISALRHGHAGRALDGLVDLAAGTSVALAVAGLVGARAILAPIAASLNVVRGAYHAVEGWKHRDKRLQVQGGLDVIRSSGSAARMLGKHSTLLGGLGVGLAPVAGAIQAGRGLFDLSVGLRNDDNKKELQGLVDIATAVGTAMAFASGVAIIPGIALAVAANIIKVGYQLSPRFRRRVDQVIDKQEPRLEKFASHATKASKPLIHFWQKIMERWGPERDAPGPRHYGSAQLAEISQLVHADGRYSKLEYRRLKSQLEEAGQKKQTPQRHETPLKPRRLELQRELPRLKDRQDFLHYLTVVAGYDLEVRPEEIAWIEALASDLGLKAWTTKTVSLNVLVGTGSKG